MRERIKLFLRDSVLLRKLRGFRLLPEPMPTASDLFAIWQAGDW